MVDDGYQCVGSRYWSELWEGRTCCTDGRALYRISQVARDDHITDLHRSLD